MIDDHEESQDEGFAKMPKNANNAYTKESRKGKIPLEKVSRKGKGPDRSCKVGEAPSSLKEKRQQHGLNGLVPKPGLHDEADRTTLADDVEDIKHQVARIIGSLANITPVIAEIKNAYDTYNDEAVAHMSESDIESIAKESEEAEDEDVYEPPWKKCKQGLKGVLAGMAKVVNKLLHNRENLNEDLSVLLTDLLYKGASKESRDELIETYPTPGKCQHLEVVRVDPEIFNSVRKDIKTDDVMLQKAQKPLSKGITAVAKGLTDLMNASEADDKAISENVMTSTMQVPSDSLSLLSDASHEIDLRRRALFKSDMKSEYRLLCSDQHPVKDLLLGTKLGKSVKDLTEASKVTSKITSRYTSYKSYTSTSSQHARPENKRTCPFLGRGKGYAGRHKSAYMGYRNALQKTLSQYQPRK